MSIDKSGSPDPLVAGTDITYTLHAHNAGPSTAPNVTIRDFLPDSVTVLSVNGGAGGSCVPGVPGDAGHPTRCAYATLAPTATATMVIVVRVKPGDHRVVTNEATVSSDVLDPDTSNNSASATTTIRVADLKLVKTSDADVYKPSSQITYTLTVTNNGPGDAENVVVKDALPLQQQRPGRRPRQQLHAGRHRGDVQSGNDQSPRDSNARRSRSSSRANRDRSATPRPSRVRPSIPTCRTTPRHGSFSPAARRSPSRAGRRCEQEGRECGSCLSSPWRTDGTR